MVDNKQNLTSNRVEFDFYDMVKHIISVTVRYKNINWTPIR